MELSELIRELRIEKKIKQKELYEGLCSKRIYDRLERGEGIRDELLLERLLSRLHIQYKFLDIMLSNEAFWQKECRSEIDLLIKKRKFKEAKKLLIIYKKRTPDNSLHQQYILSRKALIFDFNKNPKAGKMFHNALELTIKVPELEKKIIQSKVISEEELRLYFLYRKWQCPFSITEYEFWIKQLEEMFINMQIYTECYFEIVYLYVMLLWEQQNFTMCIKFCKNAIALLQSKHKFYYLAEFYYMQARSGMKLEHSDIEQQKFYQQYKIAYFLSISLQDLEFAQKISNEVKEEFGWHIIN